MKRIFVILILFLTGCTLKETPVFISCETVNFEAQDNKSCYQGFIDRGLDVELGFGVSGQIKKIYVSENDFVKKGETLAILDDESFRLEVLKAKSELDIARVKNSRAKSYFERISKLYKAGGISFNDWENAQTDLKSSINQIEIAEDTLKIAKKKDSNTKIIAPNDGYIIKTRRDEGEFVIAGEKVIYFQGKGELEGKIFVPENSINLINKGDFCTAQANALGDKNYRCTVKSKVNSSIKEGAYRVTISINQDVKEILDGMSINVCFKNKSEPKILIPKTAILKDDMGDYVFILDKNQKTVSKKYLILGDFYNEKVEVKKGLNPGDNVVFEGIYKLKEGSKVEF